MNGQKDEMEADAISSILFKLRMRWAVEEGNVFVWCFFLLMWHLMARSINVDCLSLHNLKRGISDSNVFKYDETKMDKTGEFVQEKNVYSNPLKGQEQLYVFTALGCYLSINSEQLEGTEQFFIHPGSQYHTAAQSFSLQIGEIAQMYFDTVRNFVHLSHFNIHGIRKGSGTHAASATTFPPLFLQLHVKVSGAWGRSWTFTSHLLQGGILFGPTPEFERSEHWRVCLAMSTLERSGCTYCFGGHPIDFWLSFAVSR
jgi:hypothetical protein